MIYEDKVLTTFVGQEAPEGEKPMLTLDLLRYKATGEEVSPIFQAVKGGRKYYTVAEQLIGIYASCIGRTAGELNEEVEEMLGSMPDFKVYRGLAKILNEYIELEPAADIDAEELRKNQYIRN